MIPHVEDGGLGNLWDFWDGSTQAILYNKVIVGKRFQLMSRSMLVFSLPHGAGLAHTHKHAHRNAHTHTRTHADTRTHALTNTHANLWHVSHLFHSNSQSTSVFLQRARHREEKLVTSQKKNRIPESQAWRSESSWDTPWSTTRAVLFTESPSQAVSKACNLSLWWDRRKSISRATLFTWTAKRALEELDLLQNEMGSSQALGSSLTNKQIIDKHTQKTNKQSIRLPGMHPMPDRREKQCS